MILTINDRIAKIIATSPNVFSTLCAHDVELVSWADTILIKNIQSITGTTDTIFLLYIILLNFL